MVRIDTWSTNPRYKKIYREMGMRVIFSVLMLLVFAGQTVAATLEEDVNRYIQIFKGNPGSHVAAAETFAWMGISDTRVFDLIEQRLLQVGSAMPGDRGDKDLTAWYIHALGFSGQQKYVPTISTFLTSKTYERYAREDLARLPLYQKWNPVISNRATFNPQYSDDVNRILNMLRSDDFSLKRLGAKRVYFQDKDEVLLDQLEKEVRANYTRVGSDTGDQIAWMIKALASSNKDKYLPLFQEALVGAKDPTVNRYAKKAVDDYGRMASQKNTSKR